MRRSGVRFSSRAPRPCDWWVYRADQVVVPITGLWAATASASRFGGLLRRAVALVDLAPVAALSAADRDAPCPRAFRAGSRRARSGGRSTPRQAGAAPCTGAPSCRPPSGAVSGTLSPSFILLGVVRWTCFARPPTARGRAEEAFLSCPLHPAGRLQVSPSAPPSSTSNDCQHRSRLERRLAPRYLRPGPRGGKRGTSLRFNPTRMTGSHPLTRRRSGSAIPRSTIDEDPPTAPLAQHAPADILWQDGPATNRRPPAVAPAR
jgi:hypothetical protein